MLAELAAANAAYAIVKKCLQNTGEIASAGKALSVYFNSKSALEKKANKKGGGSDLEEFMALEVLRNQEIELREIMIWQGRPGLWQDWVQHQAMAARGRREASLEIERARIKRNEQIYHAFEILLGVAVAVLFAAAVFFGGYIWWKYK